MLVAWCLREQPENIGGDGEVVKIDESKFGKEEKNINVGRLEEGQWVFGGTCWQMQQFFLVPVDSRDAETLLTIKKRQSYSRHKLYT